MPDDNFSAMRQSIIDGAPDTASGLAQQAVSAEKAGLRSKVKIMVGGAPVTRRWADEIGADGYAKDAMRAVELARQLMEQKMPAVVEQL
jgi:cobalamin-dependent methionine synthase I